MTTRYCVARSVHFNHADDRSPPMPIDASTTASIKLAASVVERTYIVRNRNHTTSSASSVSPDRNDATSNSDARAGMGDTADRREAASSEA
ncbi:MAG: hypothetical protein DMF89_04650 [Acidobacteria bacterium]|nr:MAG: hypothetical protein DMF89_04650 [Acidobacteriota bacterium]